MARAPCGWSAARTPACAGARAWVSRRVACGGPSHCVRALVSWMSCWPGRVKERVLADRPLARRADGVETEPHPLGRKSPDEVAALGEHHLAALAVDRDVDPALLEGGRP